MIAAAVALDQASRGQGNAVELGPVGEGRGRSPAIGGLPAQRGHFGDRPSFLDRVRERGNRLLAVVHADRVDLRLLERARERRCGVSPDDDERIGRRAPHVASRFEHAVVLESVHTRDADEPRARPLDPGGDPPEAQIDDRRRMPTGAKSRGDVLEPERLDAKEGTQAKALVSRVGAQEKDVHRVAGL